MAVNILAIVELVANVLTQLLAMIEKLWPDSANNQIVLDIQKLLGWVKSLPVVA